MATTVSEAPKMGIEMMLERIMGAMEKQVREDPVVDGRGCDFFCWRHSRAHQLDASTKMRVSLMRRCRTKN